jgi:hypothetical protein
LLAWKVKGRLRKKEKQVKESLKGCFNEFHRTMLKTHYALYQFLSRQVEELEAEIALRMQPHADQVNALATIPGVEKIAAWHLIAELGADMSVFPDADHCASWAGGESGELRKRGQAVERPDQEGQQVFAADLDAIGVGRFALQTGIPASLLPPRQGAARMGAGGDCRRA